jgi:AraC-like DNA-binding protein
MTRVTFDWIQLAIALGAVQGLLLAAVLVAHRTNRVANRLLAALMAVFTISLASVLYYASGLTYEYPHLFGISYPLPWVFGPLVYLYTLAASDRAWRFRARHALHFAPVIAVVIVTLPIYLMSGSDKMALFDRLQAGDVPTVLAVLEPTKYLSGLAYSVATVLLLRRHGRRVRDSYSNTERVNLRWLLALAGAAAAIWLFATVTEAAGVLSGSARSNGPDLDALAVALLVYAIGYMGLRQPEIFRYDVPPPKASAASAPTEPAPEGGAEQPAEPTDPRQPRTGLGEREAARLKADLLALMEREHLHRDPELTLASLAEALSSTPHKVSELLNAELGQTFYDFVNGYRVDEVRRRLAEPKAKQLSVLALAMDAGFASKSTFNDVFKKRTGQTPSTYRKALAG